MHILQAYYVKPLEKNAGNFTKSWSIRFLKDVPLTSFFLFLLKSIVLTGGVGFYVFGCVVCN